MGDLLELTADQFEILAVRELRKAGFEVADMHTYRRSRLPEPETGYVVEFLTRLGHAGRSKPALVGCRRHDGSLGREAVDQFDAHLDEAKVNLGLLFAAAEVAPDALAAAEERGLGLLRVVDGRTAFDLSGGGVPGHYPAWLPAYVAQLGERDAAGRVTYRMLEAGQAGALLARLGREEKGKREGGRGKGPKTTFDSST